MLQIIPSADEKCASNLSLLISMTVSSSVVDCDAALLCKVNNRKSIMKIIV